MKKTTRRAFVKSLGLFTGAVSTSSAWANIIVNEKKELGVALVGLGYYSRDLLAPALQLTNYCSLAGVVTGTPSKAAEWSKKYGIKDNNVYSYDSISQIANNDDIDVIYIVLPTGLHAEYAIKAANTGKHVWCEKPMARTADECQSIIEACNKNNVKLSIGYRMHHEPNTRTIMDWATKKPYGKIKEVSARAGYFDGRTDHWKQKKSLGGGAMYDMGVYSLNAARYATGEEPVAVTAYHETTRPEIYTEVDETTYFDLEFPSGAVAKCVTSFGRGMNDLRITSEHGWYELSPFQAYSGIKGITSDGKKFNLKINNQQARQMDDDSLSILNDTPVMVPGIEGMRDIRIVEAVYKSAKTGEKIILS